MHTILCPKTGEPIQVDEKDVLLFPDGLVGCPDWQRFVILDEDESDPVKLLQSLDNQDICLLVTDPLHVCDEYAIHPAEADLATLELEETDQVVVLCTLRVWEGGEKVTANLLGPLMINPRARIGRQLVLPDSPYSTQHPVVLEELADLAT